MSAILQTSTICSMTQKKEVLKKYHFFDLSGWKINNFEQRASLAFFHLITKAPSSGQELITRSLQRLSLSFLRYASLRWFILEIAFQTTEYLKYCESQPINAQCPLHVACIN